MKISSSITYITPCCIDQFQWIKCQFEVSKMLYNRINVTLKIAIMQSPPVQRPTSHMCNKDIYVPLSSHDMRVVKHLTNQIHLHIEHTVMHHYQEHSFSYYPICPLNVWKEKKNKSECFIWSSLSAKLKDRANNFVIHSVIWKQVSTLPLNCNKNTQQTIFITFKKLIKSR